MGAYNSAPVTVCESFDAENARIQYGASSMQGWRRTQEDALNCCSDFDPENESMLFAVYDGHGGSEVAEHCAKKLPDFLKQSTQYIESDTEGALIRAFVEFDRTLTAANSVDVLKTLAKRPQSPVPPNVMRLARRQEAQEEDDDEVVEEEDVNSAPVDCDEDETAGLLEDACIPVEQVLHRLTNGDITGPIKRIKGNKTAGDQSSLSSGDTSNGSFSSIAAVSASGDGACSSSSGEPGGSGTSTGKALADARPSSGDEEDDDSSDDDENASGELDSADDESEDEEDSAEMRESQELALKFTESEEYLEVPGSDSGCTACMALIRGNKLYVANAGDSRCVLSRNGKAIDLSVDHKPEDTVEKERIDKAGGFVTPDGRVNGNLNLSRAIGDHNYKRNKDLPLEEQMISPLPDIQQETLTPSDDFIIVACDGIWNSLTSQECVDFVKERLDHSEKISLICEDLFHTVLADDTVDGDGTGCDNMTCIIIDLQKSTRPDPKNHRTSSTGFDHTLSEDMPVSPTGSDTEPKAKKAKI